MPFLVFYSLFCLFLLGSAGPGGLGLTLMAYLVKTIGQDVAVMVDMSAEGVRSGELSCTSIASVRAA